MKTLPKQTSQSGTAKSMFSPEDSHANPSPSLVEERERTITATSGLRCFERYGRYTPLGSLVKTLLESRRWWSPAKSLRWDAQTIFSKRITYREESRFTLDKICADLEAEGYSVQPIVIPACSVGAPHRRDRVWIVARRISTTPSNPNIAHTQCDGYSSQGHGNQRAREKKSKEGQDRPQPGVRRHGSSKTSSYSNSHRQRRRANKQKSITECSRSSNLGTRRSKRLASHALQHRSHEVHKDNQSQFPNGARIDSLSSKWSSFHPYSNGDKTLQPGERTERKGCKRDVQPEERSTPTEWTDRLSRLQQSGKWRNFPTQSPVCRGNDGIPFYVDSLTISFPKWRQESIKAYGNAWVPQVAYEIFRAIEAEENNK